MIQPRIKKYKNKYIKENSSLEIYLFPMNCIDRHGEPNDAVD